MELKWSAAPWQTSAAAAALLVATVAAAGTLGAFGVAAVLLPTLMVAYSAAAVASATAEDRQQTLATEREIARLRGAILRDVGGLVGIARAHQAAEEAGVAAAVRMGLEVALLEGWRSGEDSRSFSGGL
jgi:hypothetical protein